MSHSPVRVPVFAHRRGRARVCLLLALPLLAVPTVLAVDADLLGVVLPLSVRLLAALVVLVAAGVVHVRGRGRDLVLGEASVGEPLVQVRDEVARWARGATGAKP